MMKQSFSAVAILALSFAQLSFGAVLSRRANPPQCVGDCLSSAIASSTATNGCNQNDLPCLCKSSAFIDAAAQCFAAQCPTADDAEQGIAYGENYCKSVGVSASIPAEAASVIASASSAQASGGSPSPAATSASTSSAPSSSPSSNNNSGSSSGAETLMKADGVKLGMVAIVAGVAAMMF